MVEDDSQDGADHLDAHREPALVISPYARRGAVIHTRYDLLSVDRSMELIMGMKPLGLNDRLATPKYDVFSPTPVNSAPVNNIPTTINLLTRNTPAAPYAAASSRLPLGTPDLLPQGELDSHASHSRRARARPRSWRLRGDVELAERAPQVRLDGLLGDEQRLGDLAVRASRGGELHDAQLAWGERVRAGAIGCPRPDADRGELGPRSALQGSGAAPRCQRERLEQGLAGGAPLSGGAERRTEVDQHARVLEPCGRRGQSR